MSSDLILSQACVVQKPSVFTEMQINHSIENPDLEQSIGRVSQLSPKSQIGTEGANVSPDFLEEMEVYQIPLIQISSFFSSKEAEQLQSMIDRSPFCKMCLYSFIALEIFKNYQELKSSITSLSSEAETYFEESWRSWQRYYIHAFNSFVKPHATDSNKKFVSNTMNKMTQIPVILRNLLKQKHAYNENIALHLSAWENCQKFLTRFCEQDNFLYLLINVPLSRFLSKNSIRFLSKEEMKEGVIQLRNYALFFSQALKAMPRVDIPLDVLITLEAILKALENLDFHETQDCVRQYQQLLRSLVAYFSYFYALRDDAFEKGRRVTATVDSFRLFDCCAFFVSELIKELQFSILPTVDPSYIKMMVLHEERLQKNLAHLNIYLKHFKKLTKDSPSSATAEINLLNKINHKFFNKITFLHSHIRLIVDKSSICSQIGMIGLPFVERELKEFSEKLKPAIDYVLQALSDCTNKFPEKLKGIPCIRLTAKIAEVFIILHDIEILLKRKQMKPYDFPQEYLQFVGLENISQEEESVEEEENEKHDLIHQTPSPSLNSSTLPLENGSSSLETKEPILSTLAMPLISSAPVPSKALKHSKVRSTSLKPPRIFYKKRGISVRQLNKELKEWGFARSEGGSHATWTKDDIKLSGPRHGKTVSPGLAHSVQKLVAEKGVLGRGSSRVAK